MNKDAVGDLQSEVRRRDECIAQHDQLIAGLDKSGNAAKLLMRLLCAYAVTASALVSAIGEDFYLSIGRRLSG